MQPAPLSSPSPRIVTLSVDNALHGKPVSLCYAHWRPEGALKGTVVAVHGLSRQKRDFDYIAGFLAENGYATYAVDAPGRGGSDWLPDPDDYNLMAFADIFAAFLRQMNLPKVHWLGTSMGGLLALVMAMKGDGGFFQTLTLNDITHRPNRAALDRITAYMSENLPVFPQAEQYHGFLRQNLPLGDVPDHVWTHYAEHQLKKVTNGYTFHFDPKLVRRAIVDLKSDIDLTEGVKQLACPLALVAGGKSDLCTAAEVEDIRALRPDVKIYIVPSAGHVPALNDDATQQFILDHLRGT